MDSVVKNKVSKYQFGIFDYKDLGSLRTIREVNGTQWYCLSDACNILQMKETKQLLKKLEEDEWCFIEVQEEGSLSGTNLKFVTLFGLYHTVGRTRRPETKDFMDWVSHAVRDCPVYGERYYSSLPTTIPEMFIKLGGSIEELQTRLKVVEERLNELVTLTKKK